MDAPYTVLRWLYTIAHKGHSFERRLGTPGWMCWFSTPDLALNQLLEAFRLVLIVMRVGAALPLSYALLRLRGQKTDKEWKMYLVRARRALVNAWMEVCFVSLFPLFLSLSQYGEDSC
jgi:hypothetical protein